MMQTFRKKLNTGMHKSVLRKGSVVNGETLAKAGAVVIRPGMTVVCVAEDLGVSGLAQFELISKPIPAEPAAPQKGIIVVPRSPGYFNVINTNNPEKPLNDKALRKEAAEELVNSLLNPGDTLDAPKTGGDEDYAAYEWEALVGFLTDREVDIKDEWEADQDLRDALIALDSKE